MVGLDVGVPHEALLHPERRPTSSMSVRYRLDLVRERGKEFSLYLRFPGPLAPCYPVSGYPRIAEFRRMPAKRREALEIQRLCVE